MLSLRKNTMPSAPTVVRVAAITDVNALRLRLWVIWSVITIMLSIMRLSDIVMLKERVELYLYACEIIEYHCHCQIDHQRYGDDQHIAQVEGDDAYECQQYQECQSRAKVDFRQLFIDVFGGVISHDHLIPFGHFRLKLIHQGFYLLGKLKLVGVIVGCDVEIYGVESVDAVVALGFGFAPLHGDEPRQRYARSVGECSRIYAMDQTICLGIKRADGAYTQPLVARAGYAEKL